MSEAIALDRPTSSLSYFARLFNVRYEFGLYGFDPCDEWDAATIMGLPEGLEYRSGRIEFECLSCGDWSEWPAEIDDFDANNPSNVCGGSPRCCP